MTDTSGALGAMDFARAIAPMRPETFFDAYFEKRHLVIQREDPLYYADLLSIGDIDALLSTTQLPVGDLNMVNKGKGIEAEAISQLSGLIDPVRVAQQFAEGGTVVLPQLHRYIPKLARYCRALETVFSCDLQTNIYLTPDNAQGFKTHYDSHDVIVLQVHGSKTWNIYESPLELPLRSQAFEPEGFVPGKLIDSFVLHAGDMCYVPRGVVHDAIATDEVSLHITTGLLAPRWIDVLVEALVEEAQKDPALRGVVPPGYANDGFDMAPQVETFHALMARAMASIDPETTLEGFAHEFRRRRMPVVPGQFLQSAMAERITVGSVVARREDLIFKLRETGAGDDAQIVLEIYGSEISFPAYCAEPLRDALTRDRFKVGDLAGDLDAEGQVVLVRRLVCEGVLFAA
ncbi:cupin domain-containing protein [Pararhodobacter oceanensis]|uniref:cupin domain-containing protein n=1 Tax=Pararhodobacter oceanensis TaxID=2172121 RepID=UPI003A934FCB